MSGRILIVDDSDITLEMSRCVLEEAGFEVQTLLWFSAGLASASALAESLSHDKTPPDLILMDVSMPGVSGDEVTQLLKGNWGIDVRVFLYSDRSEEDLGNRANAVGANGYICKGWGTDRLVESVREIFAAT